MHFRSSDLGFLNIQNLAFQTSQFLFTSTHSIPEIITENHPIMLIPFDSNLYFPVTNSVSGEGNPSSMRLGRKGRRGWFIRSRRKVCFLVIYRAGKTPKWLHHLHPTEVILVQNFLHPLAPHLFYFYYYGGRWTSKDKDTTNQVSWSTVMEDVKNRKTCLNAMARNKCPSSLPNLSLINTLGHSIAFLKQCSSEFKCTTTKKHIKMKLLYVLSWEDRPHFRRSMQLYLRLLLRVL